MEWVSSHGKAGQRCVSVYGCRISWQWATAPRFSDSDLDIVTRSSKGLIARGAVSPLGIIHERWRSGSGSSGSTGSGCPLARFLVVAASPPPPPRLIPRPLSRRRRRARGGASGGGGAAGREAVDVGVILDRTTWVGNVSWACMELALEDFYADARYRTRVTLHLRDTGPSAVDAASADSPCRSASQTPYFIRTAWNDSSQVEAIASLVQEFNWREVVPVIEDGDSNTRFIPDLVDALGHVGTRVSYRCKIHSSAGDDEIKGAISSLKGNWTSVFVVRMSYSLALKFFRLANEEGMMGQGFVWITAYGLTDILEVVGSPALDVMNGVVGVEPYVEDTARLQDFKRRWHEKYKRENQGTKLNGPILPGLYAYDTVWALASAAGKARYVNSDFLPSETNNGSTDFDRIRTSKAGEKLHDAFLKTSFIGMTGTFRIQDWKLVSTSYKIINVVDRDRKVVGFWTPGFKISSNLNKKADLYTIIWPGGSDKGKATGFCARVFEEVIHALPYEVPIHYEEFGDGKGESNGTYDSLVYKVYLNEFDAVVGDITILANRSLYVDFTLPYTESGVRMLVPVRDRRQKTAWTFLKPLSADLWLGTGAFFVFTGFIVWFIEHRTNPEFRGPPASQIGSIFYFSFSTLVFAHRERIVNNLSRIAVVFWLFVVLILQQSYTASLSSIFTVEQLQPTVTNLDEVIRRGDNVGYLNDSFLPGLLKRLKINESKLIPFNSPEEYNDALSTGRVAVIVDEIPYLKLFLSKYCHNYTMVGPTYKFDGFGYAFPRGSPLTPEISRGILELASNGTMAELEKELYGDTVCPDKNDSQTSSSLTLHSFLGLFIITGASSLLALVLHVGITLYSNRSHLIDAHRQGSWRGSFAILSKIFHEHDNSSNTQDKDETGMANPDPIVEIPWSMSSHTIENFDMDTDMGSPLEGEGTPGREVSNQDPGPPSFAYMHSDG
nr:unnamed protein product [Digitaria exilis]